jgi:hypothetical protein
MLLIKIFIEKALVFAVFIVSSFCISAPPQHENSIYSDLAYSSLKTAILNSAGINNPPNDSAGLIILLSEIDTEAARSLLVELTNYYLGSATGEALTFSLVYQGTEIVDHLSLESKNKTKCVVRKVYGDVRCKEHQEKVEYILHVIRIINSGQLVEYEI